MRFGVILTGGNVEEQLDSARAAEAAGWDGVFTWDGIHLGDAIEVHDPWVLMSAFAVVTERVKIGEVLDRHVAAERIEIRPCPPLEEVQLLARACIQHGQTLAPAAASRLKVSPVGCP